MTPWTKLCNNSILLQGHGRSTQVLETDIHVLSFLTNLADNFNLRFVKVWMLRHQCVLSPLLIKDNHNVFLLAGTKKQISPKTVGVALHLQFYLPKSSFEPCFSTRTFPPHGAAETEVSFTMLMLLILLLLPRAAAEHLHRVL